MRKAEITTSVVLAVAGLILAFVVIPDQTVATPDVALGPAALPRIYAGLIAVLATLRLLATIRAREAGAGIDAANARSALMVFSCLLASIVLFVLLSPLVAGLFLVVSSMLLMGERRIVVLVATPSVLLIGAYLLFDQALGTSIQ